MNVGLVSTRYAPPVGVPGGRRAGGWQEYPFRRMQASNFLPRTATNLGLWTARRHKNYEPPGTAVQRTNDHTIGGISGEVGGIGSGVMLGVGLLAVYMIARKKRWI